MDDATKMRLYSQQIKKYLPGGVHYNFNLPWEETPLHFTNTKNSRVFDMDGKEYLDLYARFGAMIVGHGNKEYNELSDEFDTIKKVSTGLIFVIKNNTCYLLDKCGEIAETHFKRTKDFLLSYPADSLVHSRVSKPQLFKDGSCLLFLLFLFVRGDFDCYDYYIYWGFFFYSPTY